MATISVIVPVYNTPTNLLHQCLESLRLQSIKDSEFIIVNDGSSDPVCESVIKFYCAKDQRFKYILQSNHGVSSARNTGICASNGEYIMFVDSDDSIVIGSLNFAIETIQKSKTDCVIFGFNENFNDNRNSKLTKPSYHKVLNHNDIEYLIQEIISFDTKHYQEYSINTDSPWSKIFKSEIIKNNNILFNKHLSRSEDALFCIQYYDKCKTIEICYESIYNYSFNIESLCHHQASDIIVRMLPRIGVCFKEYLEARYKDDKRFIDSLSLMIEKYLLMVEERYFFNAENSKTFFALMKEYCQLLGNKNIRCLTDLKKSSKHRTIGYLHRLSWSTPLCALYFSYMRLNNFRLKNKSAMRHSINS